MKGYEQAVSVSGEPPSDLWMLWELSDCVASLSRHSLWLAFFLQLEQTAVTDRKPLARYRVPANFRFPLRVCDWAALYFLSKWQWQRQRQLEDRRHSELFSSHTLFQPSPLTRSPSPPSCCSVPTHDKLITYSLLTQNETGAEQGLGLRLRPGLGLRLVSQSVSPAYLESVKVSAVTAHAHSENGDSASRCLSASMSVIYHEAGHINKHRHRPWHSAGIRWLRICCYFFDSAHSCFDLLYASTDLSLLSCCPAIEVVPAQYWQCHQPSATCPPPPYATQCPQFLFLFIWRFVHLTLAWRCCRFDLPPLTTLIVWHLALIFETAAKPVPFSPTTTSIPNSDPNPSSAALNRQTSSRLILQG